MIKILENINTFILYKILLKIIALALTAFIVFNCIFSSSLYIKLDSNDLLKFSSVQKDIFSAVFFVSNTIEKINFSLTSKIVSDTATKQTDSNNKKDKSIPYKSNDFIITGVQIQNELSKIQNMQNFVLLGYNILRYDYGCLFNAFYNLYKSVVCVFIIFLFFSSIKKLYDSCLNFNINRGNPAFIQI